MIAAGRPHPGSRASPTREPCGLSRSGFGPSSVVSNKAHLPEEGRDHSRRGGRMPTGATARAGPRPDPAPAYGRYLPRLLELRHQRRRVLQERSRPADGVLSRRGGARRRRAGRGIPRPPLGSRQRERAISRPRALSGGRLVRRDDARLRGSRRARPGPVVFLPLSRLAAHRRRPRLVGAGHGRRRADRRRRVVHTLARGVTRPGTPARGRAPCSRGCACDRCRTP